jgi:signal transduction histidine kinase
MRKFPSPVVAASQAEARRRMAWLLAALRLFETRTPGQLQALGIAAVAVLGVLDYVTGYEVYFAFLYLLPISLITWYVGLRPGLMFVALSSAAWLLANDLAGAHYSNPFIYAWNLLARVFVLTFCAVMLSALRAALAYERELTARLKQAIVVQRRLNRMLRERLRITDRLAAGVAHEVRNPLGTLLAGTEFLARRERLEPERTLLEDMRVAVARADLIVGNLVDFSTPMRLNIAPGALHDAIRQATREAHRRAETAEVSILSSTVPEVELRMDSPRIVQVLVNLLHNAIDASPRGGSVSIGARATSARELTTEEIDDAAKVIAIDIEDDGPGIPPERLAQAFEPFYTTKSPGAGTGLGLSISRRIVDDHGGLLWLANRSGHGLRATLILPIGGTA